MHGREVRDIVEDSTKNMVVLQLKQGAAEKTIVRMIKLYGCGTIWM